MYFLILQVSCHKFFRMYRSIQMHLFFSPYSGIKRKRGKKIEGAAVRQELRMKASDHARR